MYDLLVFIVSCRQVCLNYHHIHRIGVYFHHHNSITESIYFCYSLSDFGLFNNCNSSLTCWTARIHCSIPITHPSLHLTSLTPIIVHLFLLISSLTFSNFPVAFIVRTFHVPTLISCFSSILCLPSPYTFRFPFQPSAVPLCAYSAFECSDGFS